MAPSTRRSSRTQPNSSKPDYSGKGTSSSSSSTSTSRQKASTTSGISKSKSKPKSKMTGTKRGNSAAVEDEVSNSKAIEEEANEDEQPQSKKQRTDEQPLKQTTLDESVITGKDDEKENDDTAAANAKDDSDKIIDEDKMEVETEPKENGDAKQGPAATEKTSTEKPAEETPSSKPEAKNTSSTSQAADASHNPPSSVLEKGILYFFTRPRVNVEGNPKSFSDIQRSYIVMRPIALKAAIPPGEIGDAQGEAKKEGEGDAKKDEGLMRVLAVPKKKLLGNGGRFLTFVEKAQTTIEEIKKDILQSSTYNTQTLGERTNPAAQPLGTAVYAITQSGRTSHLVYVVVHDSLEGLTPLQKDFGLKDTGSLVLSVKNPKSKSAPGVGLNNDPGYSEDLQQAFQDRAWNSVSPGYLEYEGAEILMIGEKEDPKEAEAEAVEELEKMAAEDEERIKELSSGKHDDGIFKDLELSKGEYGDGIKMEF